MTDVSLEMEEMEGKPETEPLANNQAIDEVTLENNIKENLLKNLLYAVVNNDVEAIKTYLKLYRETDEDLRYHKFRHELKDKTIVVNSILVIACVDENVEASTLGTLFTEINSKYGNVNYSDEKWFGWEPIHYIARMANADKLKALLNIHNFNVNALTYFSENALHVLLQYEEYAIPFGVVLNNSRQCKCATIIGTEKNAIEECAKMLIHAGIDVNQTNFWNETPICLAVRYRYLKLVKLLLSVDSIDLDSFIESGKTIREYLKWNLYIALPKSYIQEDPVRIRFNFLKSGDEESFLNYNTSTLIDNVNSLDGDSYTMLQFCLRKGFLEYLENDHYKIRRLNNYDIKDNPMLTVFKTKGLARCVVHLLDNGADTSIVTTKFKETLLEFSSLRGYYPFVAILLQHKNSKIESKEIFDVLSKLFSTHFNLKHHGFYVDCVLYILLNKLIFLFRQNNETLSPKKRNILNKVLYRLNLENEDKKINNSENIIQILHLGASLTYMPQSRIQENETVENKPEEKKGMVVQRMDYSLLKTHFDDCIHGTTFNYNSIIQDDDRVYNENRTIHFLVTDTIKQQLLTHPLLIQLIREKWSKIYGVFYADLVFYTFLLLGIYWYTVSQYFGHYIQSLYICYWFLIIFHMMKESIQFAFLYRWKYFLEPSNILETATIACCLTTIFIPNIYTAVGSILFSTFIFFLLLGQLPFFTKYTIIFSSIKYFFQYMAFYSIQFVAFSICFYLVFPFENSGVSRMNHNSTGPDWGDISKSLFYTLIYFTGEFSDRVLEPTDYPVFGRLVMTVFIFCMTIILNNLLVGLIVADMDDIQQSGRLYKQVKLASFIQSTNTFIKRLHDYKYFNCVKKIIKILDVFEKGHKKVFENVNIHRFDDENKKYLRDIRKIQIFDRHMLKELYNEVLKK